MQLNKTNNNNCMKSYLFKSLWVAMIGVFFNPLFVKGQTDLTKETAFFQKAGEDYQRFLEKTELENLLKVDTVQVFPDLVILNLRVSEYGAWLPTLLKYEEKFQQDFCEMLFDKAIFLFRLDYDSLGIRIYQNDDTNMVVGMRYEADSFSVYQMQYRGQRQDEISISEKYLPKISKENNQISITTCKNRIEKGLQKEYGKDNVTVVKDKPGKMKVTVKGIRAEVIDDNSWFPYWEYLEYHFTFKVVEKKVIEKGKEKIKKELLVTYTLHAKLGSSIWREPREYYDIDDEGYTKDLNDYVEKIRPIIRKSIINKN